MYWVCEFPHLERDPSHQQIYLSLHFVILYRRHRWSGPASKSGLPTNSAVQENSWYFLVSLWRMFYVSKIGIVSNANSLKSQHPMKSPKSEQSVMLKRICWIFLKSQKRTLCYRSNLQVVNTKHPTSTTQPFTSQLTWVIILKGSVLAPAGSACPVVSSYVQVLRPQVSGLSFISQWKKQDKFSKKKSFILLLLHLKQLLSLSQKSMCYFISNNFTLKPNDVKF